MFEKNRVLNQVDTIGPWKTLQNEEGLIFFPEINGKREKGKMKKQKNAQKENSHHQQTKIKQNKNLNYDVARIKCSYNTKPLQSSNKSNILDESLNFIRKTHKNFIKKTEKNRQVICPKKFPGRVVKSVNYIPMQLKEQDTRQKENLNWLIQMREVFKKNMNANNYKKNSSQDALFIEKLKAISDSSISLSNRKKIKQQRQAFTQRSHRSNLKTDTNQLTPKTNQIKPMFVSNRKNVQFLSNTKKDGQFYNFQLLKAKLNKNEQELENQEALKEQKLNKLNIRKIRGQLFKKINDNGLSHHGYILMTQQ